MLRYKHVMLAEGQFALPGGGAVGWCEWGKPEGQPVVLLHGTPGSRFFLADPAGGASAGLRVLTFDRPGYGLSTPPVVLTLSGVVEIVERLADERGLDRFPVVGFSGGVPYALACGALLGSRVTSVAAVSGGGPVDELPDLYASLSAAERALVTEIRDDPAGATERLWDLAGWYADTPLRMLDTPQEEPDARVLDDPEIRANLVKSNLEGARQGQAGLVADWIADALPGASPSPTSPRPSISGSANATRHEHHSTPHRSPDACHEARCTPTQKAVTGCS